VGFSPDFFEGNMDGCLVHLVIDLVPPNAGKPLQFKDFCSVLYLLVVFKGSAIPDDLGS
jgi:hypothetical protein